MSTDQATEHIGETRGVANHDHDLVHELSKRLDGLWRYDQCIANADDRPELQKFWRGLKTQEEQNVLTLKELIAKEIGKSCF